MAIQEGNYRLGVDKVDISGGDSEDDAVRA